MDTESWGRACQQLDRLSSQQIRGWAEFMLLCKTTAHPAPKQPLPVAVAGKLSPMSVTIPMRLALLQQHVLPRLLQAASTSDSTATASSTLSSALSRLMSQYHSLRVAAAVRHLSTSAYFPSAQADPFYKDLANQLDMHATTRDATDLSAKEALSSALSHMAVAALPLSCLWSVASEAVSPVEAAVPTPSRSSANVAGSTIMLQGVENVNAADIIACSVAQCLQSSVASILSTGPPSSSALLQLKGLVQCLDNSSCPAGGAADDDADGVLSDLVRQLRDSVAMRLQSFIEELPAISYSKLEVATVMEILASLGAQVNIAQQQQRLLLGRTIAVLQAGSSLSTSEGSNWCSSVLESASVEDVGSLASAQNLFDRLLRECTAPYQSQLLVTLLGVTWMDGRALPLAEDQDTSVRQRSQDNGFVEAEAVGSEERRAYSGSHEAIEETSDSNDKKAFQSAPSLPDSLLRRSWQSLALHSLHHGFYDIVLRIIDNCRISPQSESANSSSSLSSTDITALIDASVAAGNTVLAAALGLMSPHQVHNHRALTSLGEWGADTWDHAPPNLILPMVSAAAAHRSPESVSSLFSSSSTSEVHEQILQQLLSWPPHPSTVVGETHDLTTFLFPCVVSLLVLAQKHGVAAALVARRMCLHSVAASSIGCSLLVLERFLQVCSDSNIEPGSGDVGSALTSPFHKTALSAACNMHTLCTGALECLKKDVTGA
eukprot:gene21356-28292_t